MESDRTQVFQLVILIMVQMLTYNSLHARIVRNYADDVGNGY